MSILTKWVAIINVIGGVLVNHCERRISCWCVFCTLLTVWVHCIMTGQLLLWCVYVDSCMNQIWYLRLLHWGSIAIQMNHVTCYAGYGQDRYLQLQHVHIEEPTAQDQELCFEHINHMITALRNWYDVMRSCRCALHSLFCLWPLKVVECCIWPTILWPLLSPEWSELFENEMVLSSLV